VRTQIKSGSEYVAGNWIAMTTQSAWMLVDAESRRDLWAACWNALRENSDVESVLAAVVREGSANVPDFALVWRDGNETRVVVRGRVGVALRYGAGANGTTLVRAAGGGDGDDGSGGGGGDGGGDGDRGWTDRLLAGTPIAFRIADVADVSELGYMRDEAVMPLDYGVAHASAVGLSLGAVVEPPTMPAGPAGQAAPVPPTPPVSAAKSAGAGEFESAADFNLDGFLLRQDAESAPDSASMAASSVSADAGRLPLDDTSWLMETTAGQPAHHVIDETVKSVPVNTETVLPQPSVASEGTSGLSFDAEATTFRPGRAPVQVGGAAQSVVLAVTCQAGHANPPRTSECRVCRLPVAAEQPPRALARPPLGRLRLSNGEVHVLDRGFLLGRSPVPRAAAAGPEPNVLRLISRDGDVSRTHAEIRLEGWQVIVADLGSMNGTYITGPGVPPRVLSGGDEQVIEPGCVVTLAHDVWIAYEAAE
jgi:hypothetical protein